MRIQLINPSPTEMTDIYIEGCEEKHVEKLLPGERKTIWVHINRDSSISMKYTSAGLTKEEIIMGYFSELHYDIQELYLDGYEPHEIASKLKISIGKIVAVLNEFGVRYDQQDPA